MPVYIPTSHNLDRITAIPSNLPIAGIDKCYPAEPVYIVSGLGRNHVSAYTSQESWLSSAYAEDYIYDRVWVTPALTEFGVLTTQRDIAGIIWNTFTTSVDLTSVDEDLTEGMVLSGLTVPSTIAGLTESDFIVSANLSGPAVIDATYTFNIDAWSIPISFTGLRSIPFSIRPQIPVTERWEWLTQILTAYDQTEQRIMLREEPRRTLSHTYKANNPYESSILSNIMIGGIGNYFSVPSWHEQKSVTSPVTADDLEIFVDTRFADFQVGWKTMIWQDSGDFEIVEVTAINETSLELGTKVAGNFSLGALVLPIHFGLIRDKVQHKVRTASLATVQVDFLFEATAVPDTSAYTPDVEYQGYQVLEGLNYCFSDNSASQDVIRPMVFMDNGQGKFQIETRGEVTLNNTLGFSGQNLEDIWDIKTFLASIAGRLKPFWALTWTNDINIVGSYTDVDATFDILPVFYSLYFSDSTTRRDLAFVKNDGTILYRRITGSTDDSLTIDSALGFAFSMSDFKLICFVNLVRSANDTVNFEWTQAGQVQISLPVKGIIS